ncbi:hypothetical protein DOM22_04710 [Bdellovibrio sp. ZAP7]|uniref:hypothetical protein n=1 Tax=Bdellovibrio sp. ZAP7 TaxID=2231053 RepID=UPI00115AB6AE|nr:hypothetical protein [Bdellovibrio sp. ZAP7]QDK44507.1 hypothetical protein DOM22_04710 [Bdellovibrio sp. ZAP7]
MKQLDRLNIQDGCKKWNDFEKATVLHCTMIRCQTGSDFLDYEFVTMYLLRTTSFAGREPMPCANDFKTCGSRSSYSDRRGINAGEKY